jgi:hypothetical protein
MIINPENREKARFQHQSPVTLENEQTGVLRGARMFNYSDYGLYLETDHRLEPETELRIGIINSPFCSEPGRHESFRGIIKWRRHLNRSIFFYGYGVELLAENAPENVPYRHDNLRKHPRIKCAIPLKYEFDSRTYRGTAENVSRSGVFINTRDLVAAGETLTVFIPAKKIRKIKRLQGRVAWSNRTGFGVRFERLR